MWYVLSRSVMSGSLERKQTAARRPSLSMRNSPGKNIGGVCHCLQRILGIKTQVSAFAVRFFTIWATGWYRITVRCLVSGTLFKEKKDLPFSQWDLHYRFHLWPITLVRLPSSLVASPSPPSTQAVESLLQPQEGHLPLPSLGVSSHSFIHLYQSTFAFSCPLYLELRFQVSWKFLSLPLPCHTGEGVSVGDSSFSLLCGFA